MADPVRRGEVVSRRRERLLVTGVVQGVGFRPFVFRLSAALGLVGWVANTGRGVALEVEGETAALEKFAAALVEEAPPLARVEAIQRRILPLRGETGTEFRVLTARNHPGDRTARGVQVPPDVALCPDCRREVQDARNRRHLYPFTTCTSCGPRFTIVQRLPYDRQWTTMAAFPLCPACRREYRDPAQRRFHAEATACPVCGPRLTVLGGDGRLLPGDWRGQFGRLIREGAIVAVKGLGGFHLACAATSGAAVGELRRRKHRPAKPFAVMAKDLAAARRYCLISPAEEEILTGREAPIVLLKRRAGAGLPAELAPGLPTLGLMLPYTPLHLLLFPLTGEEAGSDLLVLTSGNAGGLPLAATNEEAFAHLAGLADAFLVHDREIANRCDDSVVRVDSDGAGPIHLRRARGYVPETVAVPRRRGRPEPPVVLGAGGHLKTTFCLLHAGEAHLSQHLGDLETAEVRDLYRRSLESWESLTGHRPRVIATDRHPAYANSARGLPDLLPSAWDREKITFTAVQHHHAHFAACLAENGLEGEAAGLVLDGTGYGEDGAAWGFEVLVGDYLGYRRHAHLAYLPLPGGEGAVRNPWRMAVSHLVTHLGDDGLALASRLFPDREVETVAGMVRSGFNSPPTSSCGRLFDAVAAILGFRGESTYEGQAAVELGEMAMGGVDGCYPFHLRGGILDPAPLLAGVLEDRLAGKDRRWISTYFQNTVAAMAGAAAAQTGLGRVVLSGGAFQNPYLLARVRQVCRGAGMEVYVHRRVPPNDGGISLGQAMVAQRRWAEGVLGSAG